MAEVKGVRVTPVRNATMPDRMSRLVLESDKCIQPARVEPMLAPALSAGANTPPAAPEVKESTGPIVLSRGIYQAEYLWLVNRVVVISSLPEPSIRSLIKKAMAAMISAQPTKKKRCWRVNLKEAFHRKITSISFDMALPMIPARMATRIIPKK